jgi:hypothetical protein
MLLGNLRHSWRRRYAGRTDLMASIGQRRRSWPSARAPTGTPRHAPLVSHACGPGVPSLSPTGNAYLLLSLLSAALPLISDAEKVRFNQINKGKDAKVDGERDDRRKRQASTATPAQPGDLPWVLAGRDASFQRKLSPSLICCYPRISRQKLDQARQRNFPIRDVMVDTFRAQMLAGLIRFCISNDPIFA